MAIPLSFRSSLSFILLLPVFLMTMHGCSSTARTGEDAHQGTQAGAPAASPGAFEPGAVEPPTVSLVVYGMSCPLCATNIDAQLKRIAGVESVHTSLADGLITVNVSQSNPPTREQIVRAVEESGFTFVRFEDQ